MQLCCSVCGLTTTLTPNLNLNLNLNRNLNPNPILNSNIRIFANIDRLLMFLDIEARLGTISQHKCYSTIIDPNKFRQSHRIQA